MTKNRPNTGEILGGFFVVVAMWIMCILCSGTIAFGDVLEFWDGPVLLSAFTLFAYTVICTLIGAYSKRNGHRSFFIAVAVTAALPLVAAALMFIVSLAEIPLSKWYISLRGTGSALESVARAVRFILAEIPMLISYPFVLVVFSMAYSLGTDSTLGIIIGFAVFSIAPITSALAYKFTKTKE